MTTAIRLALLILVLVLLLGAGAWYYLFGPNKIAAADLVPADSLFFATIPNAARLLAGYDTSQLKKLVDAPEAKPLLDSFNRKIGGKNLDLLQAFLPEMSGQSFVAVTHFDPANPAHVGLIGGLKPKPGAGNFDDFVDKVKAAYPNVLAQGTTGAGQVDGLDYQWIKGPGASDKICIARHDGWIITSWGEDTLRDWWGRYQKKPTTPSLSDSDSYKKSLQRVGVDSQAFLYVDYHAFASLLQQQIARTNPAAAHSMAAQIASIGAAAVGTKFENGEIADRFSMLMPHEAQVAVGIPSDPCAFETMKFTGPDTRLYLAGNVNFARTYKNLQDQAKPATSSLAYSPASVWMTSLQNWAQSKNLDVQRNIVDALGNEFSLQAEWSAGSSYPEVGLFVKLDKPDDFKPTAAAIIDTIRRTYANSAVVNEINSNGQNFATLKFIQSLPISPTITEDGPYFGLFLTENQAVNSFKRDPSIGLLNNSDFKRQLGDRQKGASQIVFMDSPQMINRGYQTALPYLSLAAMFNRNIGALLQGRTLPPDLQWLAPMGTWTFEWSADQDGFTGYSVSGIGNQGIMAMTGLGMGSVAAAQFFHPRLPATSRYPGTPPPLAPISAPAGDAINPSSAAGAAGASMAMPPSAAIPPPAPILPPAPSPQSDTNAPAALAPSPAPAAFTAPDPNTSTNSSPAPPMAPPPDTNATMNAAPAPAPFSNAPSSAPTTNP